MNFIPCLSGGGAERQLSHLASHLIQNGNQVHIVYMADGPVPTRWPQVELHKLKFRSAHDFQLLIQMVRLIRRIKPNILHTWNPQMDVLGGIASRITGIPWVIREANSAMNYSKSVKRRIRVRVASKVDALVSNSIGGDEYWHKKVPDDRRYIIRNSLPLEEMENAQPERADLFLECGSPYLMFVGRLEYQKNVEAFLDAVAELNKTSAIDGVICGEGSLREKLETKSKQLGIDHRVCFTGHLPPVQIWGLMKQASLFYFPSRFEGCPNTIMEAMVCECPVVVSDIPSHREILTMESAYFVNPADTRHTAEVIRNVLLRSGETTIRIRNAKQISNNWSISKMAEQYEGIYEKLHEANL